MLASIGVPGLNGFVGEFLILAGTFLTHRWWAVVATVGVILAAVYLLWAYQQAFHGKPEPRDRRDPRTSPGSEGLVLAPLVVLIVLLGVFPGPVLDRISPSVTRSSPTSRSWRTSSPPQVGAHGRGVATHRAARSHEPARRRGAALRHSAHQLRGDPARADPHRRGVWSCSSSGQLVFTKVPTAFYSVGIGRRRGCRARRLARALARRAGTWALHARSRTPSPSTGSAIVFLVLVSCILILASAIGYGFLTREGIEGPEYHVLALLAGSGAMLMAAANDLILIFVALEIMSIPLYVLAGHRPAPARVGRGGDEVLRPRGVLLGDLRLRDRPRLRGDRLDQPRLRSPPT